MYIIIIPIAFLYFFLIWVLLINEEYFFVNKDKALMSKKMSPFCLGLMCPFEKTPNLWPEKDQIVML